MLDTQTGDVAHVDSAGNINPLGNALQEAMMIATSGVRAGLAARPRW